MKLTKNDQVVEPNRRFVPGKGEYLGQTVKWVEVQAIQPPFDSIFKAMVTLLFVVLLGFYVGWKGPEWIK